MAQWSATASETIDRVFDRALEAGSDRPFLDFSGVGYTYGATAGRIARTAAALHDLGVRPGDTVVTMLDNNIDAVTAAMATARLGASSCVIRWRTPRLQSSSPSPTTRTAC